MSRALKFSTIQLRRDSAPDWQTANPVLADGELGIETHPGSILDRIKIGDGVTRWNDLPYLGATDLGVNGLTSPTLGSIVVMTESQFSQLADTDDTTAYFVLPDTP